MLCSGLFQLTCYHFVVHFVAYRIAQEDERFCHFFYAVSGFWILGFDDFAHRIGNYGRLRIVAICSQIRLR